MIQNLTLFGLLSIQKKQTKLTKTPLPGHNSMDWGYLFDISILTYIVLSFFNYDYDICWTSGFLSGFL